MPWRKVNVSDQRLEFVVRCRLEGGCLAALCREFGVSRQTGYTWLRRYDEGGAAAVVQERSRRPANSPRATPPEMAEAIKALRRDKPDWGARKLLAVVQRTKPELAGMKVSATTVQRILDREGLIAAEDRHRGAVKRFERKAPNELWQMDFKGPQGFNQGTGPLSILDDHSRYLLALEALETTKGGAVRGTLQKTFESCGLPEFLLVDHGTPWYNAMSFWGWTELSVWILRQGIRMILSGVRHPQTQGKVERMHGALQSAKRKRGASVNAQWLEAFRQEYNFERPHEGIGMVTPASRWRPSPRLYQPHPPEWEYPADWAVHRLGSVGELRWRGQRWEISGALTNQLVGLQPVGDRVLVYFCNVALREIDLRTGRNTPLPANPFHTLLC